MIQKELFARALGSTQHLSGGAFGQVHAINDEWVVKYVRTKEGTLNWLEWCWMMQRAGMHMRGMPEIDIIIRTNGDDEKGGYAVTMRRYKETLAQRNDHSGVEYMSAYDLPDKVRYIKELRWAYADYWANVLRGSRWFESAVAGLNPAKRQERAAGHHCWDDLHGGNVMWDERTETWIITDPACHDYIEAASVDVFPMYVEEPKQQPPETPAESLSVLAALRLAGDRPVRKIQPMMDRAIVDEMVRANDLPIMPVRPAQGKADPWGWFAKDQRRQAELNRLPTDVVRGLPSVRRMATMPPPRFVIHDELAAPEPLKVRRANTAEKREYWKHNKHKLPFYHHGRRF